VQGKLGLPGIRTLRNNIYTRTRKIMNYTWISQSQKKFWWRVSELCWRANRLLDLCIEAKDSSNNLVAGYIRNFSQESSNYILVLCGKAND